MSKYFSHFTDLFETLISFPLLKHNSDIDLQDGIKFLLLFSRFNSIDSNIS